MARLLGASRVDRRLGFFFLRACLFGRTGVRFRLECEPGGLVFARGGEQGSLIGFLSCDFECETDASVRFDGEGGVTMTFSEDDEEVALPTLTPAEMDDDMSPASNMAASCDSSRLHCVFHLAAA